jgi:hypothetical protein
MNLIHTDSHRTSIFNDNHSKACPIIVGEKWKIMKTAFVYRIDCVHSYVTINFYTAYFLNFSQKLVHIYQLCNAHFNLWLLTNGTVCSINAV